MTKKKQNLSLYYTLFYIAKNDIKGFISALKQYNYDINLNFYDLFSNLDPYAILEQRGWKLGEDFDNFITKDENKILFDFFNTYETKHENYNFLSFVIYLKKYYFCKYLLNHYDIEIEDLEETLQLAIKTNNLKIYKLITDYIDKKYLRIFCPNVLFKWVGYNGFNIFKYLVEEKHYNPLKYDIWRYATYGANIQIIKYLIKNNYKLTYNKLTLMLDVSVDDGYDDVFDYLVKHVCKTPKEYNYALYAAFTNHDQFNKPLWLIKYCTKKGADINYRFKNYDTLITEITRNCYSRYKLEVIDYLLKHNVNLKKKDRVGRTYLEYVYRKYIEYLQSENEETHEISEITEIYFKLCREGYYDKTKIRKFSKIPKDSKYNWKNDTWNNPYEDTIIIEE